MGQGFGDQFCPYHADVAAPGSGNEPQWYHSQNGAQGFLRALFAYGCTEVYIILGQKDVSQPGCCPDPSHGDRAGDTLSRTELQLPESLGHQVGDGTLGAAPWLLGCCS